jgi:tRNA (mo5U34)-methyltransferase
MPPGSPDSQRDRERLLAEVAAYRWYHRIDLGDGIVTPGENRTGQTLKRVRLPESLAGQSVLDIGAWDGFFSFEAERRGAERVVAVDPECWGDPSWGSRGWGTKGPFDLARRTLGSSVEDRDIALLDISPTTIGTFDVVLFLGVFYHLPNPWPYLQAAASACADLLIVETHADLLDLRRPAMAFYPGSEVGGDPSNWWGPNASALAAMLGDAGFRRVTVYTESRVHRLARTAVGRLRSRPFKFQQGRIVAHARR